MNIIDTVLRYCAPLEWEETTRAHYESRRYRLYDLGPGDVEYTKEINAFVNGEPRLEVTQIQRVQNPYQLGRFVLRQEQKRHRGEHVQVVNYYHPLRQCDLEAALEHNMDVRRYCNKEGGQCSGQNPKFYKTPGPAYQSMNTACEVMLVCNVLENSDALTTSKTNDTEFMPTYVVKLTEIKK